MRVAIVAMAGFLALRSSWRALLVFLTMSLGNNGNFLDTVGKQAPEALTKL